MRKNDFLPTKQQAEETNNDNKVNRRFTGRELKSSGAAEGDETER
jgi:hypothetical protein